MKKLKIQFTSAILVAGIVLTATFIRTKVQADPAPRPHATAILYIYEGSDGGFVVGGFSTSGAGLPTVKVGDSAADAINILRDAGLKLQPQSNPTFFTLIR